jgi:hypothetical protein
MRAFLNTLLLAVALAFSVAPASAGASHATRPAAVRAVFPGEILHAPMAASRYTWLRCNATGRSCRAIPRAHRATYLVRVADVGHRLRVRMVIAGPAGQTVVVSDPSPPVSLPLPVNTSLPTISGVAQQGQTLTGDQGGWTGAVTFTYQWQDCDAAGSNCTPITGATGLTYLLQASDVGHTIRFQVTAYNFAQAGASADSRVA